MVVSNETSMAHERDTYKSSLVSPEMDESSSGFGDESPILFKPAKKLDFIQTPNKHNFSLDEVHKRLLQHLKKGSTLPKADLKAYLNQVKKMNPEDHKSKWLLMKIKGLLSFILKRRCDFQYSIVKGEITIYEKSASQQTSNVTARPEPPKFHSQPESNPFALLSDFLTNDDFVSVDKSQNLTQMEVESNINYSEDLFGTESLHSFSHENYQMLKRLTQNSEDTLFKTPPAVDDKINKVYKLHDTLEEGYNSFISSTTAFGSEQCASDVQMGESHGKNKENVNVFDDMSTTNDQLKEDFDLEFEQTEKWMSEIIDNLIHLQVDANHKICNISVENKENNVSSGSSKSGSNIPIKTYYSEENLKIIREVCFEFKKNLEVEMKKNKKLDVLRELLNSSN